MTWLARKDKTGRTQTMHEHSIDVGALCEATCAKIELRCLGKLTGLLHDLGKCTTEFADILDSDQSGGRKVKHALFGARYAVEELGGMGSEADMANDSSPCKRSALLIASAIVSHHQGLIDLVSPDGIDKFGKAVFQENERYQRAKGAFLNECASEGELAKLFEQAVTEVNNLESALGQAISTSLAGETSNVRNLQRQFSYGMVIRFVTSALIDADRYNAYAWRTGGDVSGAPVNADWDACRKNVSTYLNGLMLKTSISSEVIEARRAVGEACVAFASSSRGSGVFRFTAATGSGKTLGMLLGAATLAARAEQTPRVFYLAPYKTILTQNAQEWRGAIDGAVDLLEHHSDVVVQGDNSESRTQDDLRNLLAERWLSPIVVSTLVQFLYTLFSPQPSRLRRFQALAGSIIIIDEIQSLPLRFTAIVNAALNFLATAVQCTIVCMTATQPALERGPLPLALHPSSEIVSPEIGFAACFDRVNIINCIRPRMNVDDLAKFVQERRACEGSALVIVNTKPAARKLYRTLIEREEDAVLLTQHLCPKHRLDLIDKIKKKLMAERAGKGGSFVCVSTSLIEAGVNLSFFCGVRCLMGLDSVAQAAGRVNRHGEKLFGNLYIVDYEEDQIRSLGDMPIRSECARVTLLRYQGKPRLEVEATKKYFDLLFKQHGGQLEGPLNNDISFKKAKSLLGLFTSNKCDNLSQDRQRQYFRHALRTAGRAAEPIDDDTEAVIVGYGEGEQLFKKIKGANIAELPKLLAKAQLYSVGLTCKEYGCLTSFIQTHEESGARFLNSDHYDECEGVIPFTESQQ